MRVSRVLWLFIALSFLVLFTGCGVPQETYDNLVQEQASLQENHQSLETQQATLSDKLINLEEQHVALQENYKELEQHQTTLQASQEAALQEIEVLTQNSDVLAEQVESLSDQNKSLSNSNLELEDKNSVLQAENTRLTSRVSEMEDRLSGYYVSGFRCTRSMIPYIDCGDEVVWKESFDPSDISVGTVIGFRVPADCGRLSGKPIAHRVTEIKLFGGEPQYQTKGDSNSLPDPCWIHRSDIDGVLALLTKGARPEDVVNAEEYDVALERAQDLEAEYRAVEASYEQADSIYSAAYDNYAARFTQYCGFPPNSARTCSLENPAYRQVQRLFQTLETERRRVNGLASDLEMLASQVNTAWAEVERLGCEILDICS